MISVTEVGAGTTRLLNWDDENRLVQTIDHGNLVTYNYDDTGKRIIKKSATSENVYVNENYSVKSGDVTSKHIFANNTRVATKLMIPGTGGGTYFYHGDHLGSSSVVTNDLKNFHEHLEYFPFGETWIQETSVSDASLPYRFTAQEWDKETHLYYFGARYYDPKLSRWISTDKALGNFLPTGKSDDLPGMGGVYHATNLNVYNYASSNPMVVFDPDGNAIWSINRKLGGTQSYSALNPISHTYIATTDSTNNNVTGVYSWSGTSMGAISNWKWTTKTGLNNDAYGKALVMKDTNVASKAINSNKAVLLTKDNELDSYVEKSAKMLDNNGFGPSNHEWEVSNNCKTESKLLFGTALDIYKRENGKAYNNLTPQGRLLQEHLSDNEFNDLYEKVYLDDDPYMDGSPYDDHFNSNITAFIGVGDAAGVNVISGKSILTLELEPVLGDLVKMR